MLGTHSLKATYLTLLGASAAFYLALFAAYAILKLFLIAAASPKSETFAIWWAFSFAPIDCALLIPMAAALASALIYFCSSLYSCICVEMAA